MIALNMMDRQEVTGWQRFMATSCFQMCSFILQSSEVNQGALSKKGQSDNWAYNGIILQIWSAQSNSAFVAYLSGISTKLHMEESLTGFVLSRACVSRQYPEVLGNYRLIQRHQSKRSLGQAQYLPFGKTTNGQCQKNISNYCLRTKNASVGKCNGLRLDRNQEFRQCFRFAS